MGIKGRENYVITSAQPPSWFFLDYSKTLLRHLIRLLVMKLQGLNLFALHSPLHDIARNSCSGFQLIVEEIRVCFSFALLCSVIDRQNSRHLLN